jgi:hypothetical protein
MNEIVPVQDTNNIRIADFVRLTTPNGTYRFATTASALTVPSVDAQPFQALGQLVKVGDAVKDIKSTANETTVSLIGIDQTMLGLVLGQNIKGSQIEIWHGFFDTNGALITTGGSGGLYQFFNGYVNSFAIAEQWIEESRSFVGVITVSASSIQLILQNRLAGRFTNNNSWTFYNPTDTSMNRVAFVSTVSYLFGKTPAPTPPPIPNSPNVISDLIQE